MDDKATLARYLRTQRDDLVAKLDGLGEYDARRPLTSTGTNLLGLVRHVASVQLDYLGQVFGRPGDHPIARRGLETGPDADLWVDSEYSRDDILELHRFSATRADATIDELPLDAPGEVPWWPEERRAVTLHQILVHLCVEVARHAGHADILRELVDGTAGLRPGDPNLTPHSAEQWQGHCGRIEAAALRASGQR